MIAKKAETAAKIREQILQGRDDCTFKALGPSEIKGQDVGPIASALQSLDYRVRELHEQISLLSSVIEPVLCNPLPEEGSSPRPEPCSPMEDTLIVIGGSVNHAIDRLAMLVRRVQL
jgi:hypothetical protein